MASIGNTQTYRMPLFDIDWTLLAGGNAVHARAFDHALRHVYGINGPLDVQLDRHGMIDSQILAELVQTYGGTEAAARAQMDDALGAMAAYFDEHSAEADYVVLPGVSALLQRLRSESVPLGLLTGNVESIGWTKLDHADIKQYFSFGAFGNMAYRRADLVPMAKARVEAILGHGVPLSGLFLVGDSPRDVECGKAAGIDVLAVASGVYSAAQLAAAGAELVLDSLDQIEEFLAFMTSHTTRQT